MVEREEMMALVRAHKAIDDEPVAAAIWIRRDDDEAWLVELLPTLKGDEKPGSPVTFNASRAFRHSLHLIASDQDGLERAVREDRALAREIAEGDVLWEDEHRTGSHLRRLAAEVVRDHARAG